MTKPLSPRAQLKQLRADLRYTQTYNRIDAGDLRRGLAKARRIGAEMRRVRKLVTKGRNENS